MISVPISVRTGWLGFSLLAVVMLQGAGGSAAEPHRFWLDSAASRVVIHVGKTGLLGFAGHEHEVLAGSLTGSVVVHPEDLARSSVDVRFQTASLRVTGKGEPKDDVPKVQQTMLGPKCLDVARFPTVSFVSKAVAIKRSSPGHTELELRGDLTLHGVTRELIVPLALELTDDRLKAGGRTTIRQTDFNIAPITVAGVVKVENEVVLEWTLVGRRTR
jgi:polyisoprenoid-binding protein YceI